MINTDELKARTNIIEVIERHVPLRKKGSEHYGTCPFHDDNKASLQANETKQIFSCFACGTAGDSIKFLTALGIPFNDAVEEINGGPINSDYTPVQNTAKQSKQPDWKQIKPPNNETPIINHYKFGAPNKTWIYHDIDGTILSYVCRFDLEDGTKQVLPFSYATNGTISEWRWLGISSNRPLYNLHLLKKYPKASIIIVEGEKTADAVQSQFNPEKTIATTWIGGANGIKKTDFKTLNDRGLFLWPDNDTAGTQAMINVNEIIKSYTNVKGIVKNPEGLPNKWDAADKEWKEMEMREFIIENYIDDIPEPTPIETQKPIAPPKNQPLPPRPEEKKDTYFENEHFRFLGYDKDEKSTLVYFFYSYGAKAVVRFTPSSISSANLLQIAPINYWESNFYGSSKIDIGAVQQYLIGNSHKLGVFKEKHIRGRGAWMDQNELIIHTGESIIIKDKTIPLKQHKSNFVYEIGENLGFGNDTPLKSDESKYILDGIKSLNWERKENAYLLAGWCVLAPFCGVLDWRPHIWVTGSAGSGKSWVLDRIIKLLMGETGVVVQGKTTEAGVRGLLQSDARPVIFDEADLDDNRDADRIQSILALARSASYKNGGGIVKGTQSGSARTYIIRSMFAFGSIGVQVTKQSDRSRFTILGLNQADPSKKDYFKKFSVEWGRKLTPDYIHSLQARTMSLLPIILENSKTFADAATIVIGSQRTADQIGGMLAGAYSLQSDQLISDKDAIKMVESMDWSDEKGLDQTKDENQLLTLLMMHPLRVESSMGQVDRSIGELIVLAAGFKADEKTSSSFAKDRLKREGILVTGDKFIISNTAPPIKEIIKGSSWGNNHASILIRLEGANVEKQHHFVSGLNSRGVSIPISLIYDGNNERKYTDADNETMVAGRTHEFNNVMDDEVPF